MHRTNVLVLLALLAGCRIIVQPPRPPDQAPTVESPAPSPEPSPDPAPAPAATHDVVFRVESGGVSLAGAEILIETPQADMRARTSDGNGFAHVNLLPGEYLFSVRAPGYTEFIGGLTVPDDAGEQTIRLVRDRARQVRGRLQARGRALTYPDGAPFRWRGITAFGLAHLYATGRAEEARRWMDDVSRRGFNLVRVLTTAVLLFDLSPEAGQAALPTLLADARERELYVELVALADTGRRDFDIVRHVTAIGAAAGKVENAVVELANEIYPIHQTQSRELTPEFLRTLRRTIPSDVLVSLGSTHDVQDENPVFKDGDYLTVHPPGHRDDWNTVRRAREQEALARTVNKPVVDDESLGFDEQPQRGRRWSDCALAFGRGFLARGFEVGVTFHCQACLRAEPLGPVQARCADAFIEGARLIPDDVDVEFFNAKWTHSPVADVRFAEGPLRPNAVVRAYSFVAGARAWLALVGVDGDPGLKLGGGWRVEQAIAERAGVRILALAQ